MTCCPLLALPLLCPQQNDFTPEQEEEVRRENQWAFD
jgi:hypothetical protein